MCVTDSKHKFLKIGAAAVVAGLLAGPAWAQEPFDPMDDPFADFDDLQQQPMDPAQQPFDPAFAEQPDPMMDAPFDDPMADPMVEPMDPFADPTEPMDPFADPADPFADPDAMPFDPEEAFPFPTGPDPETQPDPDRIVGTTEPAETGITQLYTFRYIRQRNFLGNDVVVRRRMTLAEGEQFDETVRTYYRELLNDGEIPMFQPGTGSAREWAEWLAYAAQVEMWQEYARNIVLAGAETTANISEVRWPGDPTTEEQQQPGMAPGMGMGFDPAMGMGMGMPGQMTGQPGAPQTVNGYEFRPVPRSGPQAGVGAAPGAGMVIDPRQMDEQLVEVYQEMWQALRAIEERQLAFVRELNETLETRERMREEYDLWREERKQQLVAWVADWSRRYDGQTLVIGDVQYELYSPDAIPDTIPRGAHLVVTDFGITPYDILDEDGMLKGPDRN